MKKLLMVCALFFAVITYANAQQQGSATPEERAKKSVERLTTRLKLTDDQKSKVEALFVDQTKAQAKIRQDAGDDKAAAREKSMALRKEVDGKVAALLSDEQKVEYKKMQDEQKAKMRDNQGGQKPKDAPKPASEM